MWPLVALVVLVLGSARRAVELELEPVEKPDDWGDAVTLQPLSFAPGHRLQPDAAAAFDAAARETTAPRVTSSARTYEQQAALYALYLAGKGSLAARPGTSKHETGLAVDARGTPAWEVAMERHGFHRPLMTPGPNYEPWHWEFKR